MKSPSKSQYFYEIRVAGDLGEMWAGWFTGLSIRKEVDEEGNNIITELYGPIADQPALYGVLNKIRDLNLTLISVIRHKETDRRSDPMKKAASIFSLLCGAAMLVVWGILLATGQVVELQSSPIETAFLLGAEFFTAAALILGGIGLLTGRRWGLSADLAAFGMLLYCAVFSIGVFGQAGNLPAAGFFCTVTVLAAVFSTKFILESAKGGM